MKALKDLLSAKKNIQPAGLSEKDIFFVFQRIIGEEYGRIGAEKLKADYFKNRTVFVKSESSAFGSELWLNREKIIRKINAELGKEEIKEIKLK